MENLDLAHHLARHVATTRYEDLPAEAIDTAKKSLLDLLGVMIAGGGTMPSIGMVMELVRETGGTPECTVFGFPDRVPAVMAAFANGAMAHCLDYDDVAPDGNHASSSLIPAVLAAAEHRGGVSGRELIAAIALGQDVFLRLRRSLNQRLDWLVTTVFGVFSATAGAARVLGLDPDRTAHALGIASLGSAGTLEMRFGTGSGLGEIYAGFVAKSAVLSAILAQKGMTGTQRLFEGQAGIMNVYFGGEYDRSSVLDGLGEHFAGSTMLYKPWPVCGIANTYIHAVLKLMHEQGIDPTAIEEMRPFVGDFQQRMSYPLDDRRRPTGSMDARFSLPFCLAVAAVHGTVQVEHFTATGLTDDRVLAMAQRVVPVNDDSLNWVGAMPDARVDISLRDGTVLSANGDGTPGGRDNPLSWADLTKKFIACSQHGARPLNSAAGRRVVEEIRSFENQDDGTALLRLLG